MGPEREFRSNSRPYSPYKGNSRIAPFSEVIGRMVLSSPRSTRSQLATAEKNGNPKHHDYTISAR